jgi:hypothetical protein
MRYASGALHESNITRAPKVQEPSLHETLFQDY